MTRHSLSISKSIAAPADQLWSLLADVRSWPRWGPFTAVNDSGIRAPRAIGLGRSTLHLHLTSGDGPYLLSYHASTGGGYTHTAELLLSPTAGGRTDVTWRAHLHRGLSRTLGRRRARLATQAGQLLSALAAYAEDPPTTRIEWAAQTSGSQAGSARELAA